MSDRDAWEEARRPRTPAPEPERERERGGRGVSPGIVFLALAIIGSIAYMGYAVTVRETTQIPLLASGAVVLALVFGALAAYSLRATWRSGLEDRGGRALFIALVGGGAAIAAAGFLAAATILFQVANTPG